MDSARNDFAHHLRRWRRLRAQTQLQLALTAEVSTRHLSWLETGRAQPSRAMVLRLAEHLDVPLRERNRWLQAAGFAPMYGQHALADAPMAPVRDAVAQLLAAYEPWPALAVDAGWDIVDANAAARALLGTLDGPEGRPPNVLRLTLHPEGLGDRIENGDAVRAHAWARLRRGLQGEAAPRLQALHDELLAALPAGGAPADTLPVAVEPLLPLVLRSPWGRLSFLTTITVFGAPLDVAAAELAIETLVPADAATAERLRELAGGAAAGSVSR